MPSQRQNSSPEMICNTNVHGNKNESSLYKNYKKLIIQGFFKQSEISRERGRIKSRFDFIQKDNLETNEDDSLGNYRVNKGHDTLGV